MMDIDKLFRCLSDYIDGKVDNDCFPELGEFPGFDMIEEMKDMEKFFDTEIFQEMQDMMNEHSECCAFYKTLCKTIGLCRDMEEVDVPEDIHLQLFQVLEIDQDD